jgi:hypothetical protein
MAKLANQNEVGISVDAAADVSFGGGGGSARSGRQDSRFNSAYLFLEQRWRSYCEGPDKTNGREGGSDEDGSDEDGLNVINNGMVRMLMSVLGRM